MTTLKGLKDLKRQLSWHHPMDDDPTSEFYTVKEKRRSINEKIRNFK